MQLSAALLDSDTPQNKEFDPQFSGIAMDTWDPWNI